MKKTILTALAVCLALSISAQNVANLKMNLEKNKVYTLKSFSDQQITQTMNGVQQTTHVLSTTVLSIKMVESTPDFFVAEIRFDTIASQTNAMGKVVNITSADEGDIKSTEASEVMACIYNRLSKNAIYVKMNFSGKVLDIINMSMLSGMILQDTALITGETAPVIKSQIKNAINDKALISLIDNFTYNLPGKEVKKGETWDQNTSINSGGMELGIATNYKIDAFDTDKASLTAESNIMAAPNAPPMKVSGATITYNDLKGLSKSSVMIDPATGLLLESNGKMHIAGNMNVSVQGMSLQLPLEINGETKTIAL